MQKRLKSITELEEISLQVNKKTSLADIWNEKESFLALKPDEYTVSIAGFGVFIVKVLQGKLQEAKHLLDNFSIPGMDIYMRIILPSITDEEFCACVEKLLKTGRTMNGGLTLTAGRPSILNGVRDFTLMAHKMEEKKEMALKYLYALYDKSADFIYEIELAEYYYQQNRCIEAAEKVSMQIPILEKKGDFRCLFAALTLQLKLLVINGEIKSASTLMKSLRERVQKEENSELSYNIDAFETLLAIYEGNYELITDWLDNKAPDEHGDFNMLDLYRYMIKLYCYLLNGKYIAIITLAEKLRPLVEAGWRQMDLCELDLIVAMGAYKYGNREDAFAPLERALAIAQKNKFLRLVGDQGGIMLKLLQEYKTRNPSSPYIDFVNEVIEIARKVVVVYPNYLVMPVKNDISLTDSEISILSLLYQGKSYDMIADVFGISINTVRYHVKKLYTKLKANSSSEAIFIAKKMGVI